jgi:hypothetical protein
MAPRRTAQSLPHGKRKRGRRAAPEPIGRVLVSRPIDVQSSRRPFNENDRPKVVNRKVAPKAAPRGVKKFSVSMPAELVDWLKTQDEHAGISTALTEIVRRAKDNAERHRALGRLLSEFGSIEPATPEEQAAIDEELGIGPAERAELERRKAHR